MSDDRDLEDIAKTATDDFYELLGVAFDTADNDIHRAYRKASITAHPDKNPNDPHAADRFIRLGIARDILMSANLKAEYDRQRTRRRERELQNSLLSKQRRKWAEDIERREREVFTGGKRKRDGEMTPAEKREAEIQRLAEASKRIRKEYTEKLQKQRQEEEARFAEASAESAAKPQTTSSTAELDRTVKVMFYRDGEAAEWGREKVAQMLEKYGKILSSISCKDKKKDRLPGEKHRKVLGSAFVVFERIDHAHAAVVDAPKDYPILDSVVWAVKEPEFLKSQSKDQPSAPSTPIGTPNKAFRASFTGSGLGKGVGTPGTPKFGFSPHAATSNSPSMKEQTMMRLKQAAEKKKLEEQIRRQEAEEEATAES
ncbi:unnamed protein product [Periconia digitata]|uniref:J domain-containing protein n=1 Tax=Periconia digitata TaxID=1303443 RepID=A0A9W4USF4_9PLEO|nr:unnamed protein product [Periconia digitata]